MRPRQANSPTSGRTFTKPGKDPGSLSRGDHVLPPVSASREVARSGAIARDELRVFTGLPPLSGGGGAALVAPPVGVGKETVKLVAIPERDEVLQQQTASDDTLS